MRARQTLDLMENLRTSLSRPFVQSYLGTFLDDVKEKRGGMSYTGTTKQVGEFFAMQQRRTLEVATPYFLAADMLPVVEYAAKGLDGLEYFTHDLFPSDHGFLLFDGGHMVTDRRGKKMVDSALVWSRTVAQYDGTSYTSPGTQVTVYSDSADPRDEVTAEIRRDGGDAYVESLGRLQMTHVMFLADDARVGPATVSDVDIRDEYGQPVQADNSARILMAFLLMLRQTITSTSREQVSPKQAQRYAKKRLPSYVTVVQMRRIEGIHRAEGESKIEWANRWLVTGHWRHQPVGPAYPGAIEEQPGEFYVRLWIAPYLKGPDGAPLKPSTRKVIALTR